VVEKINASQELKILEEKREALEKAVKIALNIERLHGSLEATLLMGKPASELPEEALATLAELEESIKSEPVDKLRESLAVLVQLVQSKLAQILALSEMDAEALVAPETGDIEGLLTDYRKQAQTAVALQVLLHSRGVATVPIELHVPTEQIRARLTAVEQKERVYRKIIRTEIVVMITETNRMLANEGLSATMRHFLAASNEDMQRNLDHLDAGKKITAMPVAIEIIEMGEREISSFDTTPSPVHGGEIPAVQKQRLVAPMEYTPASSAQSLRQIKKKKGVIARLIQWMTTPDQITWRRTKQNPEEKRGKKN
jgi:hypothetical protein